MTTIVATLNKNGIAIAADSAGSVGSKVFSSNKLFPLGKNGACTSCIAVYGALQFMSIPIELLVKEFALTLNTKSGNMPKDITNYKDLFFRFLIKNPNIVESETSEWNNKVEYIFSVLSTYFDSRITIALQTKVASGLEAIFTETEIFSITENLIDELLVFLSEKSEKFPPLLFIKINPKTKTGENYNFTVDDLPNGQIESIYDIYFKFPKTQFLPKMLKVIFLVLKYDLGEVMMQEYIRNGSNYYFSSTGIVFAGYGENQLYPGTDHINIYFLINGILAIKHIDTFSVSTNYPANVVTYAQGELVFAIAAGISPSVENHLIKYINTTIDNLTIDDESKTNNKDNIKNYFAEVKQNLYIKPMIEAISFLSLSELAFTSESFVNLTSFKKHVTMGNEDVGGPTDLAVISKHDGFQWIKCKSPLIQN